MSDSSHSLQPIFFSAYEGRTECDERIQVHLSGKQKTIGWSEREPL